MLSDGGARYANDPVPLSACTLDPELVPITCNVVVGSVVPIPTLPDVSMEIRSFVPNTVLNDSLNLSLSLSSIPNENALVMVAGTNLMYGSKLALES